MRQIAYIIFTFSFLLKLEAASIQTERPNVLFILADDQSPYDLKIYDPKSPLDTPVLDRLANEGIVIDGAYHMGSFVSAVCRPSRHMIMTGRTLWRLPHINPGKPDTVPDSELIPALPFMAKKHSLPALFNRAGYDTMRTCKKGNSYEAANELFNVREDATKRGADDDNGSGWHAERVLDYLRKREEMNDKDPFFIYFGFSHPHDTRNGKSELLKKYGATNHKDEHSLPILNLDRPAPQLPPNYLPAHPINYRDPGARDEERVSGVWKRRDEATVRNELGREYACSENIDIQIGRVLNKLESMGELENTYIIYTSDHGIAIGRHGLMGKQNLYEHSWRVPFIVKGPGVKQGERAQANIYLLDILATLCDLCGIEIPGTNEGISFKPVLEGQKAVVRESVYGVFCGDSKPGVRAVRKDDWKLIKYDTHNGSVRETQLFNLADNPDELLLEHHNPEVIALTGNKPMPHQRNLAEDPMYAEKRAEMEALLFSKMKERGIHLNFGIKLQFQSDGSLGVSMLLVMQK